MLLGILVVAWFSVLDADDQESLFLRPQIGPLRRKVLRPATILPSLLCSISRGCDIFIVQPGKLMTELLKHQIPHTI